MKIVIVGAGLVGRSIAKELIQNRQGVVLIDKTITPERMSTVPEATWLQGDACEISFLATAGLASAEVVVAATGDDKVNLVVSLLAKTEYGVPRTIARVSNPKNEWMFDESWGVDVAVSTPRVITALVEEAVSVGRVVPIFDFQAGTARLVELTLPEASPAVGRTIGSINWTPGATLVGIVRDGVPIAPTPHDSLEPSDELLFLVSEGAEVPLQRLLVPRPVEATTTALPAIKPQTR